MRARSNLVVRFGAAKFGLGGRTVTTSRPFSLAVAFSAASG